jgi:outer membrane protein
MLLKINQTNRLFSILVIAPFFFTFSSSFAQSTSQTGDLVLSGKPLSLAEAVEITLKNSATIQQQQLGVELAKAQLQTVRGSFDITSSVTVSTSQNRPVALPPPDHDMQGLTGSLSKLFRSGIFSSLSLSLNRTDPLVTDSSNTSNLGITVTIPLLKGRGSKGSALAVAETNARLNRDAAILDYYHQISQVISTTIQSYWDYRAAIANLKNQRILTKLVLTWSDEAEERASLELEKKFASQIRRLEGYLTEKQRNIVTAEERVNTTKSALAEAMGIPYNQLVNLEASEDFPGDWSHILRRLQAQPMKEQWVQQALQNRFDIQAQQLRLQTSANGLAKARQDLLPQLDLSLSYTDSGEELGDQFSNYFGPITNDPRGRTTGATLTLTYPLGNNAAKGSLDAANVNYKNAVITTDNQSRTVSLQVDADEGKLMSRLQEVDKNRQTLKAYEESLTDYYQSINSLAENPSTLFDLIDLERDFSQATNEHLESLLALAKAVAQLRFQTGTLLVQVGQSNDNWDLANMATLPGLEDLAKPR